MGYVTNIEQESLENKNFRRVLYTARHSQLVLMSLLPKEEIGEETHGHLDQFLRFEAGRGKVVLNGDDTQERVADAVVVAAGTSHKVINLSDDAPLKLYTIYSPPEHKDGTIHATKTDALADKHDHFEE